MLEKGLHRRLNQPAIRRGYARLRLNPSRWVSLVGPVGFADSDRLADASVVRGPDLYHVFRALVRPVIFTSLQPGSPAVLS